MRGEDPKERLEKIELEEEKLPPSNSTKLTSDNLKSEILQKEKFKDPPDSMEKRGEDEIIPDNSISSKDKVTFSPTEISTPSSTEIKEKEEIEEREIERGEVVDCNWREIWDDPNSYKPPPNSIEHPLPTLSTS